MPSLRRTASSPAVRSSPYTNSSLAVRGNGHRRSSGSETTSRRVLADIEWWRVTEGQCDASSDQEQEDRNRGIPELVATVDVVSVGAAGIPVTHVVEAGVDQPASSLPMPWATTTTADAADSDELSLVEPPTAQFSGLSITPHTPTRRHHTLQSTSSSLESTPEASDGPITATLGGLGLFDVDSVGFPEAFLPPLTIQRRNRLGALAPVMTRSYTFADCLSLKDDHAAQYADFAISPLSSAPDFLN